MKKRAILWFRQDLRLHDNEALRNAIHAADEIIPVYVFDERTFKGKTRFGFPKTGIFRAKFIIESVINLRKQLQNYGADLVVRIGKPEEEIFDLARNFKSHWVFCNRERTQEEVDVQDMLEQNLWTIGQEIWYSRGKMLFHTQDLPFPINQTPDTFGSFKKEVERVVGVRIPLEKPENGFSKLTAPIDRGEMPNLRLLGYNENEIDNSLANQTGGETIALDFLDTLIADKSTLVDYKANRNQYHEEYTSSGISAWLAQGCLSPKLLYHTIDTFEKKVKQSRSTVQLKQDLILRDFYRLMGKKNGNMIFQIGGILGEADTSLTNNMQSFNKWSLGKTGVPMVDAFMNQLNSTGYLSSKGRFITASYLIHDLKVNWIIGAEYFESLLIDYDPCSNYGNWMDIVGIGSDRKIHPKVNLDNQARKFDPRGVYTKKWLSN